MTAPERIWAKLDRATVYMDGSSPLVASTREFRGSTAYVRADIVTERCSSCDGAGDVHRADGEWLGECNCGSEFRHAFDVEANPSKAYRVIRSQAARIAALEAQLAERVKVKQLEWSGHPAGGEQALAAGLGLYRVHANGDDWYLVPDHMGKGGTAAAQADYARRILSALEATPPAPCVHPIWGQDIDGTRTCGKCGLTTPPTHPEPDFSKSIAGIIKEESAKGAAVGWRSCTGCHETNEGYETGHFPYSKMFGCYVGSGCNECGGIGVTWEYWSEDVLKTMAEDDAPPVPKVTDKMVEAAAEVIWNSRDARIGGAWETRSRDEIAVHITLDVARAALTAAQEAGKP